MINPMDWLTLLVALGTGLVTATGVVIGIRAQLLAFKEHTTRELETIRATHRREIELLQLEARECRERIDSLLTLMARHRPPEKD